MKKQTTSRAAISASLANFDALPDSAHVRLPTVMGLYGIGPATTWRYVKSGRIPKPRRIGPRIAAWQVGELRVALKKIGP